MSNFIKIILFVAAIFFAIFGYIFYQTLNQADEGAELSCMASISTATAKALETGQIKLTDKSRKLSKEEINLIINQKNVGDCSKRDYLFEKIHIAIGEDKASKGQIRIWTNGEDGISGTKDDLVFPLEENDQ